MIAFASLRVVRVVLAFAVAFWMAGAGCMFGCEGMTSAAAASNSQTTTATNLATIVSGDACASMQSHDCCARHRKQSPPQQHEVTRASQGTEIAGLVPAMANCPLAINASAVLSNPRTEQSKTLALPASAIIQNAEQLEQRSAFLHPLRLPNRGHTYLRCCVFLI